MGSAKSYNRGGSQHAAEKLDGSLIWEAQQRHIAGSPISGYYCSGDLSATMRGLNTGRR
jgi:hypothetical protein